MQICPGNHASFAGQVLFVETINIFMLLVNALTQCLSDQSPVHGVTFGNYLPVQIVQIITD